jgi:hypothetical protein
MIPKEFKKHFPKEENFGMMDISSFLTTKDIGFGLFTQVSLLGTAPFC